MTTTFKTIYSYLKSVHLGNHPHPYWHSETVSLYGMEEVACYIRLSPLGEDESSTGHVSLYLYYTNTKSTDFYLEVEQDLTIGTRVFTDDLIVGNNSQAKIKFGESWGFSQFCDSGDVLKKPVEVGFSVTIKKVVETSPNKGTITTTPMGKREYDYTKILDFTK